MTPHAILCWPHKSLFSALKTNNYTMILVLLLNIILFGHYYNKKIIFKVHSINDECGLKDKLYTSFIEWI